MKRLTLALAAILVLGCFASAQAATEVKMTGDFRVYGNWWSGRNFTGWSNEFNGGSSAGSQTEDSFGVNQRFRLRTDFVANEALKFRLGIRVNNQWWGRGTLTADAPAVSIDVYQAFLQFKWPDTDIEFTVGRQPLALPQSGYFDGGLVFDSEAAAIVITAPLIPDTLSLLVGYSRFYDDGQWDGSTTQVADELDLFFMALPITLDGFSVTPWTAIGIGGRDAGYDSLVAANLTSAGSNGLWGAWANTQYAENLQTYNAAVAAGLIPASQQAAYTQAFAQAAQAINKKSMWENNQNTYWWLGGAIEVDALDPIKFYADVIYGQGAMSDRKSSQRHGWFIDAAIEYTGWDVLTPSVFGWWSTGEDGSWTNGSERMPYTVPGWNAGTSFLFDGGQELGADSNMYMNPVGTWGIGASLKDISFIEKLTHRITVAYVQGTNSSKAIRATNLSYVQILNNATAVAMTGASVTPAYYGVDYTYPSYSSNGLFAMGRDLTVEEYVIGVNFDHKYMIYENLAAILETGYAHGSFQKSVWGSRLVNKASDAWRVALGLQYKF
ncbi:outer membrane homotrimeric porin [Desulfolutivibrio sulfoxidireducens]|uniref:outer membrane homotrimeric porin n=1 Tax=Desulfolutivibrio sulfoxidireducens TaxID=2773299 RepID=UPI00159DA075|nr:outer membrane homotrimeric porin [Desulfolutivibrio sulfoxidireducens]QLA15348.1 outer membrane homotrimeric porin [Desulfolutivibrio sulfoxidireducens]